MGSPLGGFEPFLTRVYRGFALEDPKIVTHFLKSVLLFYFWESAV